MADQKSTSDDNSVTVPLHGQPQPLDQTNAPVQGSDSAPETVIQPANPPTGTQSPISPASRQIDASHQYPASQAPGLQPYEQPAQQVYNQEAPKPSMPEFMQPSHAPQHSEPSSPQAVQPVPLDINTEGQYFYTDPNQELNLEQEQAAGLKKKTALRISLVLLILIVVVGAAFYISKLFVSGPSLTSYTISNQGNRYSLNFIKNAKTLHVNAYESLEATDPSNGTEIIALVYNSTLKQDCGLAFFSLLTPFKKEVDGKKYSVCANTTGTVYLSDFKDYGHWYEAAVYSADRENKVSLPTTKAIINSVKVVSN